MVKQTSQKADKKATENNAPEEVPREIAAARKLEEAELDRNVFRALKRDLIGLERENLSEVILQKCAGKGDWFEVAEHSALIYYYYVLKVLKVKNVRFEDDYDSFYEQYEIGRIRTRGTDVVRKRLKEAGLYGGEHVIHGRLVFTLKKTFTKDRMKALKKKEAQRRMEINKTLEVAHSDPLFYRNLMELTKWLHQICSSRLSKLSSQTNGARIVTLVDGVMTDYLHSTDLKEEDVKGRIEDWKAIRSKIYRLKYEVQVIDAAGLWSAEVCLKAFEAVIELKKSANKNLVKLLEERKNERTEKAG